MQFGLGRARVLALWLLWLGIGTTALVAGLGYYTTPLAERGFSPLHQRFAPTGVVGHGLGIAGTAMVGVGVLMYSIRKRLPALARLGRLKHWLEAHIFLCTLGPFLVMLHTSFKIGGLVAIAFWSMTTVVVSGVVGRYLYVRIPKTIHGHFLTLRELEERKQELSSQLAKAVGVAPAVLASVLPQPARARAPGASALFIQGWRADVRRRSGGKRLRRLLAAQGVPVRLRDQAVALADEQARLEQAVMLLEPFQRMFRYWHVFHLPLALLMFAIVTIHVIVAVLFGYGWPF